METLAAIALAGNILQFVETRAKFAKNAAQLYNSVNGKLPEHEQLGAGAADLQHLMETMQSHQTTARDPRLNLLVGKCWEVSTELVSVIDSFGLPGEEKRWLKSVSKSFQATRMKPQLEELKGRLDAIRAQICARLTVLIRYLVHIFRFSGYMLIVTQSTTGRNL